MIVRDRRGFMASGSEGRGDVTDDPPRLETRGHGRVCHQPRRIQGAGLSVAASRRAWSAWIRPAAKPSGAARFPRTSPPTIHRRSSPTGILYAAREDGVVFAARVEEKFELLGENPMGERIMASPVPVANRLFLRGDRHLFCVAGE